MNKPLRQKQKDKNLQTGDKTCLCVNKNKTKRMPSQTKKNKKKAEFHLQHPEVVSPLVTLRFQTPAPSCHGYSGVPPAPCQSGLAWMLQ